MTYSFFSGRPYDNPNGTEFMSEKTKVFDDGKGIWLDPCCGLGILSITLASLQDDPIEFIKNRLVINEKDKTQLDIALNNFKEKFGVVPKSFNEDFLEYDFDIDYIIMNPPYFKYKSSDIYAYFLEKSCDISKGIVSINPISFTNGKNFKNTSTLNCRVRGPFDHIPNHQGQSEEGRYVRIEAYRDITYRDQRDVLIDPVAGDQVARFKVRENAVIYNATPSFDTTDNKNLSFTCLFNVPVGASAINFIDGFDSLTQTGIKITALFSKYSNTLPEGDLVITLTVNSQIKTYTINNFSSGNWHAMVISISNEFSQCGAYVYRIVDDPSDLINHSGFAPILSSTSSFTQSQFNLAQNYILPNSLLWISNIRLFNTMLREEDHDFILSQQYLKDESMLILIDNCKPQIDLPYVSKNR
jgi:hypothetical protein